MVMTAEPPLKFKVPDFFIVQLTDDPAVTVEAWAGTCLLLLPHPLYDHFAARNCMTQAGHLRWLDLRRVLECAIIENPGLITESAEKAAIPAAQMQGLFNSLLTLVTTNFELGADDQERLSKSPAKLSSLSIRSPFDGGFHSALWGDRYSGR